MEEATFAAGCFWGVDDKYRKVKGVVSTQVGYTGGTMKNPNYEDVCTGNTGHAEAVRIQFNPDIISYEQLLGIFFSIHDPTTLNRQGTDVGTQYRSAIFYHSELQKEKAISIKKNLMDSGKYNRPVVTEIVKATEFYKAEEYHQKYLKKHGTCSCG